MRIVFIYAEFSSLVIKLNTKDGAKSLHLPEPWL